MATHCKHYMMQQKSKTSVKESEDSDVAKISKGRSRYQPPRFALARQRSLRHGTASHLCQPETETITPHRHLNQQLLFVSPHLQLLCFAVMTLTFATVLLLFPMATRADVGDVLVYSAVYSGWCVIVVPFLLESLKMTMLMPMVALGSLITKLVLAKMSLAAYNSVYPSYLAVNVPPSLINASGESSCQQEESDYNLQMVVILTFCIITVLSIIQQLCRHLQH